MLPIDAIRLLYEVGKDLVAFQKSLEAPEVVLSSDLLKMLSKQLEVIRSFEESGEDITGIRDAANAVLKGFDNLLLQMCIQTGSCDKTDKLQQIRKGIHRQIEMLKPCPAERNEIKQLERGVRHHENVVKVFAMMVADKSLPAEKLNDVRPVIKTNVTNYRKRLNELCHGPLAIRATADSLSERCSKLLQSEIVGVRTNGQR